MNFAILELIVTVQLTKLLWKTTTGDARPWLMACWKARGRISIRVNWLFSLPVTVPGLKCVQLSCFLFALKFYLDRVVPINHSWRQKTRDTGLADMRSASFCVPSFRHSTEVWRTDTQTDRQTQGRVWRSIYSASFAVRCKIDDNRNSSSKPKTRNQKNTRSRCQGQDVKVKVRMPRNMLAARTIQPTFCGPL